MSALDQKALELHPFLTSNSGGGQYFLKASFRTMDQMHRAADVITKALLAHNASLSPVVAAHGEADELVARLRAAAEKAGKEIHTFERVSGSLSSILVILAIKSADRIDTLTAERDGLREANEHANRLHRRTLGQRQIGEARIAELEAALTYARPIVESYGHTQGNSADYQAKLIAPIDAALSSSEGEP